VSSPYRRGLPVLFVGAAIVVLGIAGIAWGSAPRPPPPLASPPPTTTSPPETFAQPFDPGPARVHIPVETDPPGANVFFKSTIGLASLACGPTPCALDVDREFVKDTVVVLSLPGRAPAEAHLADVADVPGGVLTLTFGPHVAAHAGEPIGQGFVQSGPRLRQGPLKVEGRLPPEVIQRIVRQNFGRFRLCYENGLRKSPTLHGQVSTRFTIDRSGAVAAVADEGSDLPDAGVVACVNRAFGSLSFPQPEGGTVTVVFPVIFTPE
jgi:hypothetical protein